MDGYVTAKDVRKRYKVSPSTLRLWEAKGRLRCVRMPGGKRLYEQKSISDAFGQAAQDRKRLLYARVSSPHQKEDLERQKKDLLEIYPDCELLSDIASGINFKRPGLQAVLERVLAGSVAYLVVTHRDRVARFGLDLLDWILAKYNCTLVVLHESDSHQGPSELAEDLLAVTTYFVAQHNGRRSAENRRRRRESETREGGPLTGNSGKKKVRKTSGCSQKASGLRPGSICGPNHHPEGTLYSQGQTLSDPASKETL